MMTRTILSILTLLLCLGVANCPSALGSGQADECDIIVNVALGEVLIESAPSGRGTIMTWSWGSLVLKTGKTIPIDDGSAFGWSVPGEMRTYGPRDEKGIAPLTFLSPEMTLVVDGSVAIESRDGVTYLTEDADSTHPLASFALLLAIIVLTALMMRTTRKNLANR